MSFFNRKKPDEFISEMPPNEYDDEEYYGEEEGEYAEDEEYEEDYDEEEGDAPAPKKNVVKTALMGVAALAVVGVGGFAAVNFFAPEMTESLVNSMPFVSQSAEPEPGSEQFTDVPGEAAAPPDGQVAPPPDDVTASADVAAVPPAPAKPEPVKPTAAAPKPAPKKPSPKPVAAKPAAKPWKPAAKPWKPKPAPVARAWTPKKSTWKPRATTRYARYYAPKKSRWTRYGRTYAARPSYARGYYGRYKYRSAYSNAKRTRYAAPRTYANGGKYAVQVGSFANPANATQLASQLRAQGVPAYVSGNGGYGSGHLVRSVAVRNRANAQRLLAQYRAAGYPSRIVPVGNGLVAVSAGVYSTPQRAQAVVGNLNQRGLYATSGYTPGVNTGNGPSRVYIGSYASRAAAAAKMRQLQNQGIPAAVTTAR